MAHISTDKLHLIAAIGPRPRISGLSKETPGIEVLTKLPVHSLLMALHGCLVGAQMVVDDIVDDQNRKDLTAMVSRAQEIRVELITRMNVQKKLSRK